MSIIEEPWHEVPVNLGWRMVLAQVDGRAAFLDRFRLYRQGLSFMLNVRSSDPHEVRRGHDMGDLAFQPTLVVRGRDGILARYPENTGEPTPAGLHRRGERGTDLGGEHGFLLSPAPQHDSSIEVAFPAWGIPLSMASLPTENLGAAVSDVLELWPDPEGTRPEQ